MCTANSGNRGSYFAGEPALVAGLIQGGHNVEVSLATDDHPVFIRWARDSGCDFHELLAGSRAPIHVVADNRDSRGGRALPHERNAGIRAFVTSSKADAHQSTSPQQEPEW